MKKEYDFSKGSRGAVLKVPAGKIKTTIRLDKDVVDWFTGRINAAGGGNFHTLMNHALRDFMKRSEQPSPVRRAIRPELRRAG